MNSVKRLLNVLAIIGVGTVAYGAINGTIALYSNSNQRQTSCEGAADFERGLKKLERIDPAQLTLDQKYLMEEVNRRIPILRERCNRSIDLKLLMIETTFLISGFVIAMLVVSLNYIVFGRSRLWNKDSAA
jgi:hypothetical protein